MARTNRPDEVYSIPKLNFWFAISALVLLVTSVWMVVADHTRTWKATQRDFRSLERHRLQLAEEAATAALGADKRKAEIAALEAAIVAADQALVGKRDEVEAQKVAIKKLEQDDYYVAKQNYNFARANLGELRYHAEHEAEHHPGSDKAKATMAKYECEMARVEGPDNSPKVSECSLGDGFKSLRTHFLDAEDAYLNAQASLEALLAQHRDATAALGKAREDLVRVQKRLEPIAPNLFNDSLRDAPMLDFLAPSLRINQVVIKEIRDDYNFATVQKEDRCHTCHLGIDKTDYELDPKSRRFKDVYSRGAVENELYKLIAAFAETKVPAADRASVKEEIATFKEKAELTLEAWAADNLDEASAKALLDEAAAVREEIRVRVQTYAAHPNLDLYLTSTSAHPIDKVGCTSCHEGRGHATEFNRVFHTPQNDEQKAEWAKKYGWHEPHYWDHPQQPVGRVTASCAKCHDAEPRIAQAAAYNRGHATVEQLGCYGCHRIAGMTGVLREAGPSLERVASKIDREFAWSWIWNPRDFRPSTKMPRFFEQTNNDEAEWLARSKQEVRGLVAYLYANTNPFTTAPLPAKGDVGRGQKLFQEVGCLGCHPAEVAGNTVNDHGPDLSGVGSKLSEEFIFAWIKNPRGYFPRTHMPSLRLTDQEAADITSYLKSLKREGWSPTPTPERDAALQETLIRETFATSMRRSEIDAMLAKMSADEREVLVGEKAIAKYGCTGCHAIKGFEGAQPIGTELSTWASKFTTQLDFGLFTPDDIPQNHIAWASRKLKNPRLWDQGKEATKTYGELLKMPNFGLEERQIFDVVTFLLSRTKRVIPSTQWPESTPEYRATQAGRTLALQYNCYGCHYVDGQGGNLAQYWTRDSAGVAQFRSAKRKDDFHYLADVPGPVRGVVPPLLLDQGNKTQPAWLFEFLGAPSMLRPQLKMRMPTFMFSDTERNTVLRYFAGLENRQLGDQSSFEPSAESAKLGQELFTRGKCTQCHMFVDRDVKPGEAPANVVAPNLKLATARLQPAWIPRWLADPQSIMPGANMPNYFDAPNKFTTLDMEGNLLHGDLGKGMNAIRDYLLISGQTYKGTQTASK